MGFLSNGTFPQGHAWLTLVLPWTGFSPGVGSRLAIEQRQQFSLSVDQQTNEVGGPHAAFTPHFSEEWSPTGLDSSSNMNAIIYVAEPIVCCRYRSCGQTSSQTTASSIGLRHTNRRQNSTLRADALPCRSYPCGRLSWLPVRFLLHVKYTLSYRIVPEKKEFPYAF